MAKKTAAKPATVKSAMPSKSSGAPERPSSAQLSTDFASVYKSVASQYKKNSTPRTKLIDVFLVFLVLLGVLQFVVCVLIGTYPFNAFLGGFISTVGQFVLTAALRLQINPQNRTEFSHSPQRAFGDFLFASLILHFIVYHFIN